MRVLRRGPGGALYDPSADDRPVTAADVAALLRAGERLRVRDDATGDDCTVDVLALLLAELLPGPAGVLEQLAAYDRSQR